MERVTERLTRALAVVGLVILGGASAQAPPAYRCETPVGCVESLHAGLFAAANGRSTNVDERFAELEPLVAATHDLAFIAEFTVRRDWPGFDAGAREAFVASFARLSAMTYAARFATVGADTFVVDGMETQVSGRARVSARIRREAADDIPLEYLLHETGDGWRIINVVADGVSDLALKRAEYRAVLDDGGVEALIAHLQEQIAAL